MTRPAHPALDASAFSQLARDEAAGMFRIALGVLRNRADAEDAVQEAFLRAWRGRAGFRGDGRPAAWLRRVVHNVAVERARRVAREVPVAEVDDLWRDDAYTVDAERVAERAATRRDLEDALVGVPAVHRAVLLLHDVEGLTVPEIARLQGTPVETTKARLRRGRMSLVTQLARADERRGAVHGVPLRCWDARRRVSEYMDGGLDAVTRRALEEHLAGCPTCPPLYTSLVGVRAALGGLRDPDSVVAPELAARIARRLAAPRGA